MDNNTRQQYKALVAQVAKVNKIAPEDATSRFSIEPSVEKTLEKRVQESSGFLKAISIVHVKAMKGKKVYLGTTSTLAGRTNTKADGARKGRYIFDGDERGYECQQTDFDSLIDYNTLDTWAHDPNFQTIYTDSINEQVAHDRIMIGFNGTSIAETTDRQANPLLQDVNKGWIQKLREERPEAVVSGMKIGKGGNYNNLDAAVLDAKQQLIDKVYRGDKDLVVIVGDSLINDKYLGLVNDNDKPTEKNALDIIITNKMVGGLPAVQVPHFPDNGFMITSLKNLAIYLQEGTTRRQLKDTPEYNAVADYRSVNEDYIIQRIGKACVYEGVLLKNAAGEWE